MNRERFLGTLLGLAALPLTGCSEPTDAQDGSGVGSTDFPVHKTDAEWRSLLSAAQFSVLFQGWTEEPGSSPLSDEHRDGTYLCAACLIPLFRGALRYDSGTGWPTFSEPLDQRLGFKLDLALIQPRTEYHCARCGGHHGHVFEDGPPPSGKRYCNNGLALRFVPTGDALPQPRS